MNRLSLGSLWLLYHVSVGRPGMTPREVYEFDPVANRDLSEIKLEDLQFADSLLIEPSYSGTSSSTGFLDLILPNQPLPVVPSQAIHKFEISELKCDDSGTRQPLKATQVPTADISPRRLNDGSGNTEMPSFAWQGDYQPQTESYTAQTNLRLLTDDWTDHSISTVQHQEARPATTQHFPSVINKYENLSDSPIAKLEPVSFLESNVGLSENQALSQMEIERSLVELRKYFYLPTINTDTITSEFWDFLDYYMSIEGLQPRIDSKKKLKVPKEEITGNTEQLQKFAGNDKVIRREMLTVGLTFLSHTHMKAFRVQKNLQEASLDLEKIREKTSGMGQKGNKSMKRVASNIKNISAWFQSLIPMVYLILNVLDNVLAKARGDVVLREAHLQEDRIWGFFKSLLKTVDDMDASAKVSSEKFVLDHMQGFLKYLERQESTLSGRTTLVWRFLEACLAAEKGNYWKPIFNQSNRFNLNIKTYVNYIILAFFIRKPGCFPHEAPGLHHKSQHTHSEVFPLFHSFDAQNTSSGQRWEPMYHFQRVKNGLITLSKEKINRDTGILTQISQSSDFTRENYLSDYFWDFLSIESLGINRRSGLSHPDLKACIRTFILNYNQKYKGQLGKIDRNHGIFSRALIMLAKSHMKSSKLNIKVENFYEDIYKTEKIIEEKALKQKSNISETDSSSEINEFKAWFQILIPVLHFNVNVLENFIAKALGHFIESDQGEQEQLWVFEKNLWINLQNKLNSSSKMAKEVLVQLPDFQIDQIIKLFQALFESQQENPSNFLNLMWYILESWIIQTKDSRFDIFLNDSKNITLSIKTCLKILIHNFFEVEHLMEDLKAMIRKRKFSFKDDIQIKVKRIQEAQR